VPSAAAPPPQVRCERSRLASSIPQTWYPRLITLPHLGIAGSPYQLFKWRGEIAPEQMPAADESVPMLPVEIMSEQPSEPRSRSRRSGVVEITFGCGTRVCLRGEVSPETLRQVIELLR
jgi:hypothetical protein